MLIQRNTTYDFAYIHKYINTINPYTVALLQL